MSQRAKAGRLAPGRDEGKCFFRPHGATGRARRRQRSIGHSARGLTSGRREDSFYFAMRLRPVSIYTLGLVLLLAGIMRLSAADELIANSPFLPPGAAGPSASASTAGTLELRSIIEVDGRYQFSIFDPAKQKGTWVGLREKGNDFVVTGFEVGANNVTVDYQGRSLSLELQKAKITALAISGGPVMQPGPMGGMMNPSGRPTIAPMPADEVKRLESVAQEVQRRREARQRAMQQGGPVSGAAPPPAGPAQ